LPRQKTSNRWSLGVLGAFCGLLVLLARSRADDAAPRNPVLDQLLDQGVTIPGFGPYRLPKPIVDPDMDGAALEKALEKAARPVPLKLFKKVGPFAPISLRVNPVSNRAGMTVGHDVRLHFVMRGKLADIAKKNAILELLGGPGAGFTPFAARQLQNRQITLLAAKGLDDQYGALRLPFPLFRAVNGIARHVTLTDKKSVSSALILDERFAKDKEFPSFWRRGNTTGDYAGLGGYVFAMDLLEPKGALYVEMHCVFHESKEWSNGQQVLRSKLPIAIRDNVLEFRRPKK